MTGVGGFLDLRIQELPGSKTHHTVEIREFRFEPAELIVAPGDTIIWINRDIVPHTATDSSEDWDSGTLQESETWQLVAQQSGHYSYYCRFHPTMKGAILVD